MRLKFILIGLCVSVAPLEASQFLSQTENPLARLKAEADRVLADASLELTPAQESAVVLMMEDRRRASEELFGDLMDFTAGPTQGQETDRLRSAIEWMEAEFVNLLSEYLTDEQLVVWNQFIEGEGLGRLRGESESVNPEAEQTQYVRIHNNAYTAEDDEYRFGQNGPGNPRPEVIQRGGAGALHGRVEFLIRDDALNARNPFAQNKPPYQERQLGVDLSGPLIPERLTTGFEFSQNEAENVDTINATLTTGVFELGIVRPTTERFYASRNTLQLSDRHSIAINLAYARDDQENQGIGGFVLPERAFSSRSTAWDLDLQQFSVLSPGSIYETRLVVSDSRSETLPESEAVQINVPDAFQSGGAQNRAEQFTRDYAFSNMYSRLGETWTLKAGTEGAYRTARSLSEANFGGAFTFSSLDAFTNGTPINYRVTRGEPLLETSQFEIALFAQNDLALTPQLTLQLGLRYEAQTNFADYNNLDPRVGFAYAIGASTVLRGGAAIFHERVPLSVFDDQQRFDGTRQFEIIIDSPSYPDPFQAGVIRQTYPSVYVTDPDIATPYDAVAGVQIERTFLTNLFVSASYSASRHVHRHRRRDLNAPLPACTANLPADPTSDQIRACRPDPSRGNILNLESTAGELGHFVRLNYRQRFSIFNLTAGYTMSHIRADSRPNNPAIPTDNYDLRSDWGRIARPLHEFDTTLNAELPLGIFLSGRLTADSGRTWTIITGMDDNFDTRVNDRPPGVRRGSEDGPNAISAAFNISKAFFIGSGTGSSRANLNLFANMTNAFNRTNPGPTSGVLTSPNFGRSTSAIDPREIEGGLRFQF